MPCVPITPDEILRELYCEYGPEGLHELEKYLLEMLISELSPSEDGQHTRESADYHYGRMDDLRRVIVGTRFYYQAQGTPLYTRGEEMHHA